MERLYWYGKNVIFYDQCGPFMCDTKPRTRGESSFVCQMRFIAIRMFKIKSGLQGNYIY